jgi:diacylglycerol kinase family enzyme
MTSCIILNPKAGRGLAARRRPEIEHALRAAGVSYDLVETDKRLGAHLLAERAVERGYAQVVAVGGDGTLNEVINGLLAGQQRSGRRVPVGIVPIGTGNDFIKSLDGEAQRREPRAENQELRTENREPRAENQELRTENREPRTESRELRAWFDLASAAGRMAAGRTRAIDVGCIVVESEGVGEPIERSFINGLGMGMDAQVTVESDKLHYLSGPLVYYGGIAAAFFSYRAKPMRVQVEGLDVEQRLLFASIGNGRCQGGSFYITPQAQIDDGLLDLCMVEQMSLPRMLRALPLLTRGDHTRLPQVTMARATAIVVSSDWSFPVATDGEVVTNKARRVTVTVEPGAIELLV